MKILALALLLGLCLALPALGSNLDSEPGPGTPAPPTSIPDAACNSTQGAVEMSNSLGLQSTTGSDLVQGDCSAVNPANLIGFAFKLTSCQDGYVTRSNIMFNQRVTEPHAALYHNYIWRLGAGGLPNDACGLECGKALNVAIPPLPAPTLLVYNWENSNCPCLTQNGETLFQGTVYQRLRNVTPFGPDWFVEFDDVPATPAPGIAYVLLPPGNHGGWVDINSLAPQFARPFHVSLTIDTACGVTPVEPTTWGMLKNLYN